MIRRLIDWWRAQRAAWRDAAPGESNDGERDL